MEALANKGKMHLGIKRLVDRGFTRKRATDDSCTSCFAILCRVESVSTSLTSHINRSTFENFKFEKHMAFDSSLFHLCRC